MEEKINICDNKYTLIYNDNTGDFNCLRYNTEWRNLVGDKMVFALFCEILELRKKLDNKND